jgi:Flp pilus assembly protein TadG
MLRPTRKFLRSNGGQAIAELAIVLPLLLMILCAIIDFGWLFANQLTLSYLSREGARYAIVHSLDTYAVSDIRQRVTDIAPDFLSGKIAVNVTFSDSTSHRAGDVRVDVTANVSALTPVVGVFEQGQTVTLSSECVMKVE